MDIKVISPKEGLEIIDKRQPIGLFYYLMPSGEYVGIDNSTGDAWTEEFISEKECIAWLKQKN